VPTLACHCTAKAALESSSGTIAALGLAAKRAETFEARATLIVQIGFAPEHPPVQPVNLKPAAAAA
jgi:hypothetical protein